jgi:DNA-binding SARP family transcriptional activator
VSSERERIDFLLERDGLPPTREWVERTRRIYADALASASSHAAAPECRRLFEEAIRDFEGWLAETG